MKLKYFLLTVAALGAMVTVTSCDYEAPKIEYKQTITNDYSDVVKILQDQTATLSEKLAALETAMANQTLSLEQKLDLLTKAVDDQNMTLSQKMDLLTAAVNNGVIKYEEMAQKIIDALDAMSASNEEKLAAIEQAVKAQTADLSAKLALIEAAIQKGCVDANDALALVQSALESLEGTLEEKLTAVKKAIDNQKIELSSKLTLIEWTVEDGFIETSEAIGYVKDAIESLEGTMEERLAAIEKVINSQTTELSSKLSLIEAAVKNGFVDNVKAVGLVQSAIEALQGTVEEKLAAIKDVINSQYTTLAAKLDLIDGTLTSGLTDIETAQDLIKDAIASLKGDYAEALKQIKDAVESMTTKLETKLGAIKTSVDEGIISINEGQELIAAAIEKASADSVTSGLNKDQILGLDLTKGCAILTLDFWKSIYNKPTSNDYKSVSDLLNATLPIPETAEIMFNYYSNYPKVEAPSQVFITCVSDCTVTPDLTSTPKLMAANTDSDFVESKLSAYGYDTENIMKYARNFVFSYNGREACAVYKVNHMVNISCTIDYNYVAGFSKFTIKAVGFGRQYCSDNNAYTYDRNLYYVCDTAPTFPVGSTAETVSFKADLVGNALLNDDNKIVKSSYDTPLGYLFTYTDYRKAGEPLKIEAIINY